MSRIEFQFELLNQQKHHRHRFSPSVVYNKWRFTPSENGNFIIALALKALPQFHLQ
jgi:hypothetical protein